MNGSVLPISVSSSENDGVEQRTERSLPVRKGCRTLYVGFPLSISFLVKNKEESAGSSHLWSTGSMPGVALGA